MSTKERWKIGDIVKPSPEYVAEIGASIYLYLKIKYDGGQLVITETNYGDDIFQFSYKGKTVRTWKYGFKFISGGPVPSKEEQVIRKIQQLWNRSEYVQSRG